MLNVFLYVWKAADTKHVSCSHLSARVGHWSEWLPTKMCYVSNRCWQGSLNPPYISVAENPIPKFDLLERWHLSLVLCSQYSDWFVWFFVFTYVLQYCWRWTGFNFGFDLLVTYTNRYIIFKRNTLNQPCSGSVSLQPRRNIAFR